MGFYEPETKKIWLKCSQGFLIRDLCYLREKGLKSKTIDSRSNIVWGGWGGGGIAFKRSAGFMGI